MEQDPINNLELAIMELEFNRTTHELTRIYPSENPSCDPEHLKIDNLDLFQDDDDWTEYWTHVPALHNIRFCHSLHHMSDHQNLPLVDILHKTSFSIDIKHTITLDK